MQKKFLFLIISTGLILGALSAVLLTKISNFAALAAYFPFFILTAFATSLFCLFSYFKSSFFSSVIGDLYKQVQPFDDFNLNTASLGELANRSLTALSALSLEITVRHFREEAQFFAYFCSRSSTKIVEGLRTEVVSFKLNSEYDAELRLNLKDSNLEIKGLINQFAAQFAYVLSGLIFSSAQSRFVDLAEQSLKAKTGFLANLSHEVRAPLGVILNATELVLDGLCGEINDNQKKFLSLSKKSSDHLLDLINDVLDYAKIEAGKVVPQPKQVSVADTLRDVLNMTRLLAESKKIEVDSRVSDSDLPVMVDKKHFRQILINMATNAVKYTQNGGTVEIWSEKDAGNFVKLSVRDTGVGIAEDQRHKVFTPFERLDEEYSKQQGGVGIGLSLAKKLAEMNGGTLDFVSELGKGTTFFLTIPMATESEMTDAGIASKDSVKAHGETIAIVDPDVGQLEIVATYFRDLGYQVISFENLTLAKEQLRQSECSLLIVDNIIFDEQVRSTKEFFAEINRETELPVILLSSRAFVFDLERYLKLGVERCLPKPAPLKELAGLCREIIDRQNVV